MGSGSTGITAAELLLLLRDPFLLHPWVPDMHDGLARADVNHCPSAESLSPQSLDGHTSSGFVLCACPRCICEPVASRVSHHVATKKKRIATDPVQPWDVDHR